MIRIQDNHESQPASQKMRFTLYSPHRLLYLFHSCIVLLSEVNLGFGSFIRIVFPFRFFVRFEFVQRQFQTQKSDHRSFGVLSSISFTIA
ncbi:hypothetical protein LEP1GSC066_2949 [Leptospira sp. serovar Kenya str. Sh9]|nr:hypothetical protein LEP1GSC066_2949 [Leptospira sp. serovar Kenya str. Sh9]